MEVEKKRPRMTLAGVLSANREKISTWMPGLLASAVIAVAATFISEHYGGPVMLYALLLGMAFYFLSQEGGCVVGIGFASKSVLRFGVALLGMRITIHQIVHLGPAPLLIVVAAPTTRPARRRRPCPPSWWLLPSWC